MIPTCLLNSFLPTYIEFIVCVAAMEENDNELTNFFVFITANSCEYEDNYSNCKDLKTTLTCNHYFVSDNCKAACKCENKIY